MPQNASSYYLTPKAFDYVYIQANSLANGLGGSSGFGENYLTANDDQFTARIDVTSVFGSSGLNLFGHRYTGLYINNNGNITFDAGLSEYTPGAITAGSSPIIAAFWADVDTRGGGVSRTAGGNSTGSNLLWYDLDAENGVLTASWDDVGYFSYRTDKLNAFQIQLVNRGGNGDFDIIFRYEAVNWTTGNASGGTDGFGGTVARAGYSAGDGVAAHYFELPISGNLAQVLALEDAIGNSGRIGTYVFQVRNGTPQVTPTTTQALVQAAANLAARAYSDAHYGVSSSIHRVNDGVSGWAPIVSSELLTERELGQYIDRFGRGLVSLDQHVLRFEHLQASASVSISMLNGKRTLGVSFEGTNFGLIDSDPIQRRDLWDDLVSVDRHYTLLAEFMAKVAAYANNPNNHIDQVLVAGHSLGGALAQEFMSAHGASDQRYIGVTFGSPGSLDHANLPASRMVNFAHTEDIVPILGKYGMGTYQAVRDAVDLAAKVKEALVVASTAATGGAAAVAAYAVESMVDALTGELIQAGAKLAIMNWLNGGIEQTLQPGDRLTYDKVDQGLRYGLSRHDYTTTGANVAIGVDYEGDTLIPWLTEHAMIAVGEPADVSYRDSINTVVTTLDERDLFQNIRILRGTVADDEIDPSRLIGGDFDLVLGGLGNDTIDGTIAGDMLSGGGGNDILDGGLGSDTYLYTRLDNGIDTVALSINDTIRVSGANFIRQVVASGDGTTLAVNQVELSSGRDTIYVGTDASPGADIVIRLEDSLPRYERLRASGTDIEKIFSYGGRFADGYIAGATLYVDANGNGRADVTENTGVTTDSEGRFVLETEFEGSIIAVGGINSDTGLPNTMTISGPGSGTIFNPLTTVITTLARDQGMGLDAAEAAVQRALGISEALDLTSYDPLSQSEDATSRAVQRVAVQLAVVASLTRDGSESLSKIASAIGRSTAEQMDLASAGDLLSALGSSATPEVVARLAQINGRVDSATNLAEIAAIQSRSLDGINDSPVLVTSTHDLTSRAGQQFLLTIANNAFTDTDGDALALNVSMADGTQLPTWLRFDSAQRQLSGIPPQTSANTSLSLRITARDPGRAEAVDYLRLNLSTTVAQMVGDENSNFLGTLGISYLVGGMGNDTYVVDQQADAAIEATNEGTDTVQATVSYVLGDNIENLTLSGGATLWAIGNELANQLTGNSAANTLDGGIGADSLYGKAGGDIYLIDDIGDAVFEESTSPTEIDEVRSSVSFVLGENIERLTLTGSETISGTGNLLANTITGNHADNTLDGRGGIDTLKGGRGNDTYWVDLIKNPTGAAIIQDLVSEASGEGRDTLIVRVADGLGIPIGTTVVLAAQLENITINGSASVSVKGNAADNQIVGNAGDNLLDGAGGLDVLHGGAGNDIYVVDQEAELQKLVELAGQGGADTVYLRFNLTGTPASRNIALTGALSEIEHLSVFGVGRFNLTGNSLGNRLVGNSDANLIDGRAGADVLAGGGGNDTYVVDDSMDSVVESSAAVAEIDTVRSSVSFSLGENIENLALTGSDSINGIGNRLANLLVGNSAQNRLVGAGGNDVVDGGYGGDTLEGGDGNDTYIVDSNQDVIIEYNTTLAGFDTVRSSVSYTLPSSVENLMLMGTEAIQGTGNQLVNLLQGNDGANLLFGAQGADTLKGGKGNDTYRVDIVQAGTLIKVEDTVVESPTEGIDTVAFLASGLFFNTPRTFAVPNFVENATLESTGGLPLNLVGNFQDNSLFGNLAANRLEGGVGNDILDGGAGADTLVGGTGNDLYVVDNVGDVLLETVAAGGGIDSVKSFVSWTLGGNLENLELAGAAAAGTGNELSNLLVGNNLSNVLTGKGGADGLFGGEGADTLIGGTGNDTYYVDIVGDVVIEESNLPSEIDAVRADVSFVLGSNLENLMLLGWADLSGKGNSVANRIDGNGGANLLEGEGGNDALDGGFGADTLKGGTGNDTYFVDDEGDAVVELSDAGDDLVFSKVSFTLGDNVENLTLLGTASAHGIGNGRDNVINGSEAANMLDGRGGVDTLRGGKGDDTYKLDVHKNTSGIAIEDLIVEAANEGYDTIEYRSSGDLALTGVAVLTLPANFENASLAATGANKINLLGNAVGNRLIGNDADNRIEGGGGDDLLIGGLGSDTLAGGAGSDTYFVDDIGDAVVETTSVAGEFDTTISRIASYALPGNVEFLTLSGSVATEGRGNSLANLMIGNLLDNLLMGYAGNDVLDGGGGHDTLNGGDGNDTYFVDDFGDIVIEDSTRVTEIDTVQSRIAYSLGNNLENLILAGSDGVDASGNDGANVLIGNDGDNRLDGRAGIDTLKGGKGNDRYTVDLTLANLLQDSIVENHNEGRDMLILRGGNPDLLSTTTLLLAVNLEYLDAGQTGSTRLNLTGSSAANTLIGNAWGNQLDGGAGADTLIGGEGNDTYLVESLSDTITEAANQGTDLVKVGVTTSGQTYILAENVEHGILINTVAFNLTGNTDANTLTGNAAANRLDGAGGIDTLIGGLGNDTYVIDDAEDQIGDSGGIDTVRSSVTHTLGIGLENLTLIGTDLINGTGNGLANVLTGNDAANVLDGGAGADRYFGGGGNDTYRTSLGDVISETSGAVVGGGTDVLEIRAATLGLTQALATNFDTFSQDLKFTRVNAGQDLKIDITSGASTSAGTITVAGMNNLQTMVETLRLYNSGGTQIGGDIDLTSVWAASNATARTLSLSGASSAYGALAS